MSNWIDYKLDVLAGSPAEMNQIAERLNQPSGELAAWIAERDQQSLSEVMDALKRLLTFKTVKNLGVIAEAENKARRFSVAFKDRSYGIVNGHINQVSETLPDAIFVLEYFDMQASYSGKRVIRGGEIVQEVLDGDQQVQGLDWALLDIFAPFKAEYYGEADEFGSLWNSRLDAVVAAATELKGNRESALPASPNVGLQQLNVTEVSSCLIPDCSNAGTHHAPGGAPKDRLCCEHYEQFVGHLVDPIGNPKFPLSD